MEFHCKDLLQNGVVLIPPSSPEYNNLLSDIEKYCDHPAGRLTPPSEQNDVFLSGQDRETAPILMNRGHTGIAALQLFWSLRNAEGRTFSISQGPGANASVLLPFGLPDKHLKLYSYWHVILPGSKRCLTMDHRQLGSNQDVRPPGPEEVWTGGSIIGFGGGSRSYGPLTEITLTLDGVFFTDGSFAGPNRQGLWEQITSSAEAHLQVAEAARKAQNSETVPKQFFAELEGITGPAEERPSLRSRVQNPEAYRQLALKRIARQIQIMRQSAGDERTIFLLASWADAPVPQFRKL